MYGKSKKKSQQEYAARRTAMVAAVLLPACLWMVLPSAAAAPPHTAGDYLPLGITTAAPTAFLEMCTRSPADCEHSARSDDTQIVQLARQAISSKLEQAFSHSKDPTPGAVGSTFRPQPATLQHSMGTSVNAPVAVGPSDYTRIDLDKDTERLLATINQTVNRALIPDTDADIYGVNDYWEAPPLTAGARGDCEDFALLKRRQLVDKGIPAAALSLAIVKTRSGEDHAVLVVATDAGDMVLDNLTRTVKPWQKTGYTWMSRQAPGDGLGWIKFTPTS